MAEDLGNAARLLSRVASRLSGSELPTSPAPQETVATDAATELRNLFPHQFRPFASSSSSSSAFFNNNRPRPSGVFSRPNSRKRKKKQTVKEIVRRFVCLADKNQEESPDAEEHRKLLAAGLGEMKVSLPEDSVEKGVRDLLNHAFPKLKSAGGFEFMYVETQSRELKVMPPGPNGITMRYLVSFIGQGKVFIRPIQENLLGDDNFESQPKEEQRSGPFDPPQREMCNKCMKIMDIHELRSHNMNCGRDDKREDFDDELMQPTFKIYSGEIESSCSAPALRNENAASTFQKHRDGEQPATAGDRYAPQQYTEYVNLLDEDDWETVDNDPDFIAAVEASLREQESIAHCSTDVNLESAQGIIKSFIEEVQEKDFIGCELQAVNILISRRSIFQST
eukprot:gene21142-23220_t